MNSRFLIICTIISIAIFVIAVFPKNELATYNYLETRLNLSNEILKKSNEITLKGIRKQVSYYPEYQSNLDNAVLLDTLTEQFIKTKSNNFTTIYPYFLQNIVYIVEQGTIEYSLVHYPNFPNKSKLISLKNSLNESALRSNERYFLNYFSKQSRNTSWSYTFYEPMILNHQPIMEAGKDFIFEIALATNFNGRQEKVEHITIDKEHLILKDQKAVFLQKATKTGWNEINVLLDVNFYSELFQQEKTFRYFVED